MFRKVLTVAIASAIGVINVNPVMAAGAPVKSVEFIGMPAPATPADKADIYSNAQTKVTYRNGESRTCNLKYHQLMATTDVINGKLVGGLYNASDEPILDLVNEQVNSDAPDANSLMVIRGMKSDNPDVNPLALVTQYEYRGVTGNLPALPPGDDYWSKLPATMSLAMINQDKDSGALVIRRGKPRRFFSCLPDRSASGADD